MVVVKHLDDIRKDIEASESVATLRVGVAELLDWVVRYRDVMEELEHRLIDAETQLLPPEDGVKRDLD